MLRIKGELKIDKEAAEIVRYCSLRLYSSKDWCCEDVGVNSAKPWSWELVSYTVVPCALWCCFATSVGWKNLDELIGPRGRWIQAIHAIWEVVVEVLCDPGTDLRRRAFLSGGSRCLCRHFLARLTTKNAIVYFNRVCVGVLHVADVCTAAAAESTALVCSSCVSGEGAVVGRTRWVMPAENLSRVTSSSKRDWQHNIKHQAVGSSARLFRRSRPRPRHHHCHTSTVLGQLLLGSRGPLVQLLRKCAFRISIRQRRAASHPPVLHETLPCILVLTCLFMHISSPCICSTTALNATSS